MSFIIIIHIIICLFLIAIVLIQRGRGSGLIESFSGMESIFGTKTDTLLTRITTVLAVSFFITCLLLAVLSLRQSRSLMKANEQPKSEQK
jgi:preprotein translocase subunit SecG